MSVSDIVAWILGIVILVVIFYVAWLRHEINFWRARQTFGDLDGEMGLHRLPGGTSPLGRLAGSYEGFEVKVDPWSGVELALPNRPAVWLDVADNGVQSFEGLTEVALVNPALRRAFRTHLASAPVCAWLNGGSPHAEVLADFVRRHGRALSTLSIRADGLRCRPRLGSWADKPSLTAEQVRALLPDMARLAEALKTIPSD